MDFCLKQEESQVFSRIRTQVECNAGGGGKRIGIMVTLMTNGTTNTNHLSSNGNGRGFSDFGGGIEATDVGHHYSKLQ